MQSLAKEAGGRQLILVVPGTEVLLTRVSVPTQSQQRLVKAVPFALEDQLGDDVDALHFALGQRRPSGEVPVAVVSRAHMDGWLGAAKRAGLEPDAVVPEQLLVPLAPNAWGMVIRGQTALVRSGPQAGFVADHANLALMLQAALLENEHGKPACIHWYNTTGDAVTLPGLGELDIEIREEACHDDALSLLAREFKEDQVINLRQNGYGRRSELAHAWRRWRAAAVMAGLWLLLQGGIGFSEYRRLSGEMAELDREIEQVYRSVFPQAGPVANARARMESRLKALRTQPANEAGGLFDLLAQSAAALAQAPGVQINGASYRDRRLDLDITIADLQGLDKLKQRLAGQAGLDVDIQAASARDGKVASRLRIANRPL